MQTPVPFIDYYLLQQIKRLNLKRVRMANQIRQDTEYNLELPGYPDSYTSAKTLLQTISSGVLYLSSEPFQNTVNPESLLYGLDVDYNGEGVPEEDSTGHLMATGEFLGTGVVVKTVGRTNSTWNWRMDLLREYFIGTRLNHLRRSVPHFGFTYGYLMCKTARPDEYLLCGKEKVLFDQPVIAVTPLSHVPRDATSFTTNSVPLHQYQKQVRDKWWRKLDNGTSRLLVHDAKTIERDDFSLTGGLLSKTIISSIETPAKWFQRSPFERRYPRSPHLLLERVDTIGNLEEWFRQVKPSSKVLYNVFFQLVLALSMAQERFSFVHCDLEPRVILVTEPDEPEVVTYRVAGSVFQITAQYVPVIIDFSSSRITHKGVPIVPGVLSPSQCAAFHPSSDFYALLTLFDALSQTVGKRFAVYLDLIQVPKVRRPGLTYSMIISLLTDYPMFDDCVETLTPFHPFEVPTYWSSSSLFVMGQLAPGDSTRKWCRDIHAALERCNQDTGSLILNTIQATLLNKHSEYIHQIDNTQIQSRAECAPKKILTIPKTPEQIEVDQVGLQLAVEVPFREMANDADGKQMIVLHPAASFETEKRSGKSIAQKILRWSYTFEEAVRCAKVIQNGKELYDSAQSVLELAPYLAAPDFGSPKLRTFLEHVFEVGEWNVVIPAVVDLSQKDLTGTNFLEKYRTNRLYLQQYIESLQIILDVLTDQSITSNNSDAYKDTAIVIKNILYFFELVPDMFNLDFIEFIRSQIK